MRCPHCHNEIPEHARPIANAVRIDGNVYKLGATSRADTQIECIANGLVVRVCHWQRGGYVDGTRVYANGRWHEYAAL